MMKDLHHRQTSMIVALHHKHPTNQNADHEKKCNDLEQFCGIHMLESLACKGLECRLVIFASLIPLISCITMTKLFPCFQSSHYGFRVSSFEIFCAQILDFLDECIHCISAGGGSFRIPHESTLWPNLSLLLIKSSPLPVTKVETL